MRIESSAFKGLLVALAAIAAPAHAGSMQARIAKVESAAGSMQGVTLDLDWPAGAGQGRLRMKVAKVSLPVLSYQATNVVWQCPLVRTEDGWSCNGGLQAVGSAPAKLLVAMSPAISKAELAVGDKRLGVENRAASPDIVRLGVERVPIAWLQAFLAGMWSQGKWTTGSMSGRVDIASPAKGPLTANTDLELADIGVETPDGAIAAASLSGRLRLEYRALPKDTRVDMRLTTHGGEFLAGSLYATLPKTPIEMHVQARQIGAAPWVLPGFEWSDPGVLAVDGKATLDAQSLPDTLDLHADVKDLSVARDRYLSGFLAPAGFADLVLGGGLGARLQMAQGSVAQMSTQLKDINAVDRQGRFVLTGVAGDLAWSRGESPVQSRLGWRNGALFGIGLGAADFPFASSKGELRLQQAAKFEVLGGQLTMDHLSWQAPSAARGATFDFGMAVADLDLGSLSQRLGWPAFTGSIGGRIPAAHFQDNLLRLDGGLEMDLFSGRIRLDRLSMERPFGLSPTLSADVGIQDIQLEPMTKVFGFGSISGLLDGRIDHLRLVDWSPVEFDARLETDPAWKGRKRISQRAVKDISSVGGSGLVAGLQAKVLSVFDDFGYEKIGLGCVLKDNVCRMDGVGSAGDGYIIVAGAGLPRIEVVGFRRRVDWPTLVARLQAATQGQAPVIQ